MPSKLPRIDLRFRNHALYEMVTRDAELNGLSDSGQVALILKQYYMERKEQAELFTPTRLHEAKREQVPVFETPLGRPALEPALRRRAVPGPEKS